MATKGIVRPDSGSRLKTALADAWIDAFNRRGLDALLLLYAPDATHFSPKLLKERPKTLGKISGKDALRDWWGDCFRRLPTLHYELDTLIFCSGAPEMRIIYIRTVDGERTTKVEEHFRLDASGRIAESRVHSIRPA